MSEREKVGVRAKRWLGRRRVTRGLGQNISDSEEENLQTSQNINGKIMQKWSKKNQVRCVENVQVCHNL